MPVKGSQPELPSISSQGTIQLGIKSDILHCIERVSASASGDVFPNLTAHIDGATTVNMKKPKVARTFIEIDLMPYVTRFAKTQHNGAY